MGCLVMGCVSPYRDVRYRPNFHIKLPAVSSTYKEKGHLSFSVVHFISTLYVTSSLAFISSRGPHLSLNQLPLARFGIARHTLRFIASPSKLPRLSLSDSEKPRQRSTFRHRCPILLVVHIWWLPSAASGFMSNPDQSIQDCVCK